LDPTDAKYPLGLFSGTFAVASIARSEKEAEAAVDADPKSLQARDLLGQIRAQKDYVESSNRR
jgi:hypothetical protein